MENKTDQIPDHVAIIMDGNGRWAKARGLPRTEGHRVGANRVREIVYACLDLGISYLTIYAFSIYILRVEEIGVIIFRIKEKIKVSYA